MSASSMVDTANFLRFRFLFETAWDIALYTGLTLLFLCLGFRSFHLSCLLISTLMTWSIDSVVLCSP